MSTERAFVTGCTEADFTRLMPVAFPAATYDPATRRYTAPGWSLTLGPPTHRAIASIRIPQMEVVFRFDTDPEPILERFFRYFQKGGG